jgi:hypothetical protein
MASYSEKPLGKLLQALIAVLHRFVADPFDEWTKSRLTPVITSGGFGARCITQIGSAKQGSSSGKIK